MGDIPRNGGSKETADGAVVAKSRRDDLMLTAIVGVMTAVIIFAFISPLIFQQGEVRRHQSAVHLRAIVQGAAVYAADHDGAYPPEDEWADVLVEGGYVEPDQLRSPESDGVGADFIYARIRPEQEFDATVVVAYEDPLHYPSSGSRAGTFVAFADAHVDWVPRESSRWSSNPEYFGSMRFPDGTQLLVGVFGADTESP